MSKLCPKCDLGNDDSAAVCRWCGGDLPAVAVGGGPTAGTGPPPPPYLPPSPPPGLGLPPPPPGLTPPATVGSSVPPAPGYPAASSAAAGCDFGDLPPRIPTRWAWAIISTILCCNPLGIVSIVYAAQVNTHLVRGDILGAQRSSRAARNWAIATVAVSVVSWIVYGIAVAIGGLGALGWLHF